MSTALPSIPLNELALAALVDVFEVEVVTA
jgi:hypothetical protein